MVTISVFHSKSKKEESSLMQRDLSVLVKWVQAVVCHKWGFNELLWPLDV